MPSISIVCGWGCLLRHEEILRRKGKLQTRIPVPWYWGVHFSEMKHDMWPTDIKTQEHQHFPIVVVFQILCVRKIVLKKLPHSLITEWIGHKSIQHSGIVEAVVKRSFVRSTRPPKTDLLRCRWFWSALADDYWNRTIPARMRSCFFVSKKNVSNSSIIHQEQKYITTYTVYIKIIKNTAQMSISIKKNICPSDLKSKSCDFLCRCEVRKLSLLSLANVIIWYYMQMSPNSRTAKLPK